jgi:D-arginine dehydrogenase
MRVVVIGAGIAGLSCAAEAAAEHDVTVLERESQPGYHSSGRSAATYIEPYINSTVMALTIVGKDFFLAPPSDFSDRPLATMRPDVMIANDSVASQVDEYLAKWTPLCPAIHEISAAEALEWVPILRKSAVARAVSDPNVMDLDVHGLLDGYRRRVLAHGGRVQTNAEVITIARNGRGWRVTTTNGSVEAYTIVDAAGAWGDRIAALAGVAPQGLVPKRRTALLFSARDHDVSTWPMVHEVTFGYYFKPDAGRLLLSPADQTPSEPCDAQPDEWDIAVAIDRFETATELKVARVEHKWAGLRSFVADSRPVIGFDQSVDGFFWLIGQGGFGVQTCVGASRLAASLLSGRGVPADLAARGVTEAEVAPGRLSRQGVF